jgi:hypothetical protein
VYRAKRTTGLAANDSAARGLLFGPDEKLNSFATCPVSRVGRYKALAGSATDATIGLLSGCYRTTGEKSVSPPSTLPAVAAHGASRLPSVDLDSYNVELRDDEGFLGDRASKGAFRKIIENWRSH